jgi:hypothetical protein
MSVRRQHTKNDVIESVRRAFAGTKHPGPGDFVHCEECEIILGRLLESRPERWEEIRSDDISYESSALTVVTPGFRTLSPEQVRAVDAFLAFIAGQTDDPRLAVEAAQARESYWARAA